VRHRSRYDDGGEEVRVGRRREQEGEKERRRRRGKTRGEGGKVYLSSRA
jgi:hypothetical protein